MNTDEFLKKNGWGGHSSYPEIARKAARMARDGRDEVDILMEIERVFARKFTMTETPAPIKLFGELGVDFDYGVMEQAKTVASLPITQSVAIMPDGHPGYGVPIGGVVVTKDAIIPGAVGVDIGCSVALSYLDVNPDDYEGIKYKLFDAARNCSKFGAGARWETKKRHLLMEDSHWSKIPGHICETALSQLGTTGGGNHFVDIVEVKYTRRHADFRRGDRCLAILTHSGSRNAGKQIAEKHMKIAEKKTGEIAVGIPKDLCWLDMRTQEASDYWRDMILMGQYAIANHRVIHDTFSELSGIGISPMSLSQHNMAWLRNDTVIHRKGAAPAGKNGTVLIPGSSGTPSYIGCGLGNKESHYSCSHGAGRPFSRTEAKRRHDQELFVHAMEGILYHGVATDETLHAYKSIERVMELQKELVTPVATMRPKIVVMGGKSDDGD